MELLADGTVTLLFSDIAGSTLLLSRLGSSYVDVMDGQRQVLRSAIASNAGTEMGTEGDGFFVAFPTAPAALAAATEAQRELAAFRWPQGETVRVRMGIHTGNPAVHGGEYIGMDVHRAARISGAAHGGQIVVSETTATLASSALSPHMALRDLGTHVLKDLPAPEHLFQLVLADLQSDFPPLKSLGAGSRLPVPITPLVGRDQDLESLTAELLSPGTRLVTLTGPGGAGKTRLALELAHRLSTSFPDGIFFVPLAAVTTAEAMWTTLAEALDVSARDRSSQEVSGHLAHLRVLLILDNLEQLPSADAIVHELLATTRSTVVVATSRRPLHLQGERERSVQPLRLPTSGALDEIASAAAIRLFVQQAKSVHAGFELSEANASEVVQICRRLDGLPLAIELAAAKTRILSPRALLRRMDQSLDIAAVGSQGPPRQQSLRQTIAWSYGLLDESASRLFRMLSVFAGGADLEAINAVREDPNPSESDTLDEVAGLVDASMVTVLESVDGEPRIGMLETMRTYASELLRATMDDVDHRRRHARHYLHLAEGWDRMLQVEGQRPLARSRFETELDNFREALSWVLTVRASGGEDEDVVLGLKLCIALEAFWFSSGHFAEERRWFELAIERSREQDSPEIAHCLTRLAKVLHVSGETERARQIAGDSVARWRSMNVSGDGLSRALAMLATLEGELGHGAEARPLFVEALDVARVLVDMSPLHYVLIVFARFLGDSEGDFESALALETEALAIAKLMGDDGAILLSSGNRACSLRMLGRLDEAAALMEQILIDTLDLQITSRFCELAEDYGAILAELGRAEDAVTLFGAADGERSRQGTPRLTMQETELAEPVARTRESIPAARWQSIFDEARSQPITNVLRSVLDH